MRRLFDLVTSLLTFEAAEGLWQQLDTPQDSGDLRGLAIVWRC